MGSYFSTVNAKPSSKLPKTDVKSQMNLIILNWHRSSKNAFNLPSNITHLIVNKFLYQPVFDELYKKKLEMEKETSKSPQNNQTSKQQLQITTKPNYDYLFKYCLIGASGAGKSCLLLRFTDNTFKTPFGMTIGIDFRIKTMNIDGKIIKLKIWDIPGRDLFKSYPTSYYRGVNAVILCYDVTDETSIMPIRNRYKHIKEATQDKDVEIILVGCKSDLNECRRVTFEEGEEIAKQLEITNFIETSAKTGENVNDMMETLTRDVLNMRINKEKRQSMPFFG